MDSEPIVSQSCEVALSMLEFERSGKSFEVSIKLLELIVNSINVIQNTLCNND